MLKKRKHEYLIWSEISRRYITEDIEFYEPETWWEAPVDKKQGSSDVPHDMFYVKSDSPNEEPYVVDLYERYKKHKEMSLDLYKTMVEAEVSPEQARMVLPLNHMVEWTWSGTLGAFSKMCRERLDPHSQYESRVVAQRVYDYLKEYYPVSAPLLVEGVY